MPPSNAWLEITLRSPLWAAVLIGLGLAGLVIVSLVAYRRQIRKEQAQAIELQALRSQNPTGMQSGQASQLPKPYEDYLQFIYNVSHEVSNPLQSIQTNLDNLASCAPEETARWQQYHALITTEIRRLSDLTKNLRLLSRLETPGASILREPVNLKGVIEGVMMAQVEIAEQHRVRLEYRGPERLARVLGDRDHLRQVLMNLVDNSIKFSREAGGEVIINVQQEPLRLVVRVIDDGVGIPAEDLPYIFDTAYQAPQTGSLRRAAGSGLGLAIVKRIVEQHGGQVRVQSQLGIGTTVSFDLPLYTPT